MNSTESPEVEYHSPRKSAVSYDKSENESPLRNCLTNELLKTLNESTPENRSRNNSKEKNSPNEISLFEQTTSCTKYKDSKEDNKEKENSKENSKEKNKKEYINLSLRLPVDANQNLHINEDAYKYMTGESSCVSGYSPSKWKTMSKKKRLEAHLQEICDSVKGKSFTYEVLGD